MSTRETIQNKISTSEKYFEILKKFQDITLDEINTNFERRGALERYLYLAVQATIDLSESVIAYQNLRKPAVMKENFDILHEKNIISGELSGKLKNMVGFRNIISHDYERIDSSVLLHVLHEDLIDIVEFIKLIKKIIVIPGSDRESRDK